MQVQTTITAAVLNSVAPFASSAAQCVPSVTTNDASKKAAKRGAPEVYQLHRVNLRTMIEGQGSRMVSVDYTKLNGEARRLTGRLGVKAYLKGGRNLVEADARSYLTLFDLQLKEYRTVNLATVTQLRCGGRVYDVID